MVPPDWETTPCRNCRRDSPVVVVTGRLVDGPRAASGPTSDASPRWFVPPDCKKFPCRRRRRLRIGGLQRARAAEVVGPAGAGVLAE